MEISINEHFSVFIRLKRVPSGEESLQAAARHVAESGSSDLELSAGYAQLDDIAHGLNFADPFLFLRP